MAPGSNISYFLGSQPVRKKRIFPHVFFAFPLFPHFFPADFPTSPTSKFAGIFQTAKEDACFLATKCFVKVSSGFRFCRTGPWPRRRAGRWGPGAKGPVVGCVALGRGPGARALGFRPGARDPVPGPGPGALGLGFGARAQGPGGPGPGGPGRCSRVRYPGLGRSPGPQGPGVRGPWRRGPGRC